MEDKILKQVNEEAFRRFPIELTRDEVDENSYRRKVFTENCEWYHNNIKESVDEKLLEELDRRIKQCDEQAADFFKRGMTASESSSLGMMFGYKQCKELILSASPNTESNEFEIFKAQQKQ